MAVAHALVRFAHISRLQRLMARIPTGWGVHGADRDAVIAATSLAVRRARRLFPADVKCLAAAATCTGLLRLQDMPAQLVIGVRKQPFEAHAWTELDGQVVNDDVAVTATYVAITTV